MNILYLTQYYPPDKGAAQIRAWEMAQNLTKLGHRVTIVTEFPNHPLGILPPSYKHRLFAREIHEGVEVIRTYVKASPKKDFLSRILFHLSFMITSIVAAIKLKHKFDLVYATSSPLFVGFAGYIISRIKGIKFVYEVRDLWLDAAVALGEAKHKLFIKVASWMERICYRHSAKVVVVTKGCYQNAVEKGVDPNKVKIVYNGANIQMFKPLLNRAELKRKFGYQGKFVALYAGNFGLVHGMDTLVETARILSDERRVEFLFVGEGPKKGEVLQLREEYGLTNLKVLDDVCREDIVEYFNLTDVCLVPAKRNKISFALLPVKMFDAWACGRPIILSVDGEAAQHLKKAQAGIWVEPENSEGIADAIKYFLNHPHLVEEHGSRGRRYVEKHFSRKMQAQRLEKILKQVSGRTGGHPVS
jgi:glycosyltransferase involved in cell wall biosynthesis